jgi:hypothetical protein
VASDQCAATLAKWFGVTEAQRPAMAPSIGKLEDKDLGFLL